MGSGCPLCSQVPVGGFSMQLLGNEKEMRGRPVVFATLTPQAAGMDVGWRHQLRAWPVAIYDSITSQWEHSSGWLLGGLCVSVTSFFYLCEDCSIGWDFQSPVSQASAIRWACGHIAPSNAASFLRPWGITERWGCQATALIRHTFNQAPSLRATGKSHGHMPSVGDREFCHAFRFLHVCSVPGTRIRE